LNQFCLCALRVLCGETFLLSSSSSFFLPPPGDPPSEPAEPCPVSGMITGTGFASLPAPRRAACGSDTRRYPAWYGFRRRNGAQAFQTTRWAAYRRSAGIELNRFPESAPEEASPFFCTSKLSHRMEPASKDQSALRVSSSFRTRSSPSGKNTRHTPLSTPPHWPNQGGLKHFIMYCTPLRTPHTSLHPCHLVLARWSRPLSFFSS
jgi:hypothetical protein